MIYRTYMNGARLTVECKNATEARKRFARIRRDYRRALARGNANGPQALNGRTIRKARTLAQLNAQDRLDRQPRD